MGLYSKYILPKVVHFACSLKPNMRQREKVVPLARGRVLEVGIGSVMTLNLSAHSRYMQPLIQRRRACY